MSEVRLVVREADVDWSGTVHGSMADCAIAALSADPVTLEELNAACARYHNPIEGHSFFSNLSAGLIDDPYDAGIVIIDLIARLVMVDSTYSSVGSVGELPYHNGRCSTKTWLRYHLADDWIFSDDRFGWQGRARDRRCSRPPLLDARRVFYGRPLVEFIACETFAAGVGDATVTDPSRNMTQDIHASWLLSPRDDLGGACPREIALERHSHLNWDLQDQGERWSLLQSAPPSLDTSSYAYRYGGFGTHELVLYYDLVRELLWSCYEQLAEWRNIRSDSRERKAFALEEFLTSEVPRLESVRDEWLNSPLSDCHGRTPQSVIDRERTRLPEAISGHDAMIDPDCPCCQMMADGTGPVFWHLDGCNMDDEFAFDIQHRTREEWEAEQLRWEEFGQRFNAGMAERERL